MKHDQQYKKKKQFPVIRYMIYLLLATSIVTGVSLSRYSNSFLSDETTRTADFSVVYNIADPKKENITASLDPSIYATCKLSDALDCNFDEIAVLRTITIKNKSEVSVKAFVSKITEMAESGAAGYGTVWCIFDKNDPVDHENISRSILKKLRYDSFGDVPGQFSDLQAALKSANDATVSRWNNMNLDISGVESAKTLTVVFWSEYDPVTASGFTAPQKTQFRLDVTTEQND